MTSLSLILAGCGGNVVFIDDGETSGGGRSPSTVTSSGGFDCGDVSFDFDVPPLVCTNGTTGCELIGQMPDGRAVRESCDGSTLQCSLFIDDVLVCTCPAEHIDFANTCGNGVPLCSDWHMNLSTAEQCIID